MRIMEDEMETTILGFLGIMGLYWGYIVSKRIILHT